eukprot:1750242-Prymnesium_polylepis.2
MLCRARRGGGLHRRLCPVTASGFDGAGDRLGSLHMMHILDHAPAARTAVTGRGFSYRCSLLHGWTRPLA